MPVLCRRSPARRLRALACVASMSLAACSKPAGPATVATTASDAPASTRWCDQLPRHANAAVRRVPVASPWFDVYQVDTNVFALVESRQWQEAISYLIVGTRSAVLWDTGIGLVPLRPVVQQLTTLPVRVMNSHTHFDHVGGNHEFDTVLAMDTPFTRENEAGGTHDDVASEVAATSFCGAPPAGADTAAFRSRPWQVARRVRDGDTLDLGGRVLEILATAGHTPDAAMLLDRAHGLLLTGDSYYDSTLWLFMAETDLDAYQRSMERVAALAPSLRRLLPAHNTVTEPPARLQAVASAVRTMRAGGGTRTPLDGTQVRVTIGDISFMTSTDALAAKPAAAGAGTRAP